MKTSGEIGRDQITLTLGNQHTYKSLYKDEESQLYFAEQFGYQFFQRRSKMITIQKNGTNVRFEEQVHRRIKFK